MPAGADEVVISRVSGGNATWQSTRVRNSLKPDRLEGAISGDQEDVIVDRDVHHGILKVDVRGDVDAGISVEEIVINGAIGNDPTILPPKVQTVVMIGVGRRIPVHIAVKVIVVYRKT